MSNTITLAMMTCVLFAGQASQPGTESRPRTHRIPLTGTASGGTLVLVEVFNRNPSWVSIETSPGEPAPAVLERLARAVNENDPFGWGGPRDNGYRNEVRSADGSIGPFPGAVGAYILTGTETGLGIPPPPKSFTCAYHPETDEIVLKWENPPGGYDSIFVLVDCFPRPIGPDSGHRTSHTLRASDVPTRRANRENPGIENLDLGVVGIRNGIVSAASIVTFRDNGQEELTGQPFTSGVAPNWKAWSTGDPRAATFESRPRMHRTGFRQPDAIKITDDGKVRAFRLPRTTINTNAAEKPFIQVVRTTSPRAVAGVTRKFLGLTPGRTYRLSARLLPLDMPGAAGPWSFSLHAAAHAPGQSDLSVEQLAGLAALPDGTTGPQAGQIARYGPGVAPPRPASQPARGSRRRTPSQPADEPVADLVTGDIGLPDGADELTVWVRHQADHSTGVGLDWIRLEEVAPQ